ncbi:hypothetical protein SAMN04488543_3786 [Friedmanniella luteola]|uniref:Uncharacterized protein n=1 Tax=Friedmanniella luteola TaxID=546871 RepID=A0A1H1ZHK1_9ACTN|nr:hypothetical protein [Friedmanniella luteola]SDT33271.1 hypothetical protein SAMN04488543_3786 [Friedmanniella luteola]
MTVVRLGPRPTAPPAEDAAPWRWRPVLVGAVVGLAWAAALRGWMTQLAGPGSSTSWLGTVGLVLLPGLVLGGLLGRADVRRRAGAARRPLLVAAPGLMAVALADPRIARALVETGQGGGAIGVVLVGLAGGYALAGRGRRVLRGAAGLVAVLGVLLVGVVTTELYPLSTPRGVWVSVLGSGLVTVFCLACALPHAGPPQARAWRPVVVGALLGLVWAAALRVLMARLVGAGTTTTWVGTVVWVLAPGAAVGALLGLAEHHRRTGGRRHGGWLVLAPLLFSAVVVAGPVRDPTAVLAGGIGGGALAVPLLGVVGGVALGARGPRVVRLLAAAVGLAVVPVWVLVAPDVGGPGFAVSTPQGAWATALHLSLLATLALAAAVPLRPPEPAPALRPPVPG